jgi:hypothetical protein
MNRGPSPDDPDRVIINCACGNQWGLPRVHFMGMLVRHQLDGLRCDRCNGLPNIHYGGMSA